MTHPVYAIGDIHGQLSMLEDALARIERDGGPEAAVVFLGDLVDRGPNSRGVIDLLRDGQAQGRNWTVLKGNHDRMFGYFMEESPRHDLHLPHHLFWLHDRLGGIETLKSYGIDVAPDQRLRTVHEAAVAAVPATHLAFLASLRTHHQMGDHLFVHAGIRPDVPLIDQDEEDLLWIREPFLSHTGSHPWLVVHGHTALKRAQHCGNRVNLDSGAGFGRPLTAAVFDGGRVFEVTPSGRQELIATP